MVGWSLIAPQPAQAQLSSLIVTVTSSADGPGDSYFPGDVPQGAVFTLPGLAAGSHTLTIEVTGLKNPASAGASIVVDAFDVTP
jgi:hypothetical protein